MIPANWLQPSLVLTDVPATTVGEVVALVARTVAASLRIDASRIEQVLQEATRGSGYAVGEGVAVPHADVPGLAETAVALVLTRQPLHVQALDGQPADIFFVVMSRPNDPKGHLLLLAHVARLAQSRVLLQGLRQTRSAEEALALIQAAELRHTATVRMSQPVPALAQNYLAIISVAGEHAVDALLVDLLDQDFDRTSILEAQSIREAVTREVPLFAGFRDIFGDPGGRRIVFLEVPVDRLETLTTTIRRMCEELQPSELSYSLIPMQSHWRWEPPRSDDGPRGH